LGGNENYRLLLYGTMILRSPNVHFWSAQPVAIEKQNGDPTDVRCPLLTKRTSRMCQLMSAFGGKADMGSQAVQQR
jgi:hypothetical protein